MNKSVISAQESTPARISHRDVRYRCILLQLDAGVTYCIAAESARGGSRRSANFEKALHTYETAAAWSQETKLTSAMRKRVQQRAAGLKQLLCRYGYAETALAVM